jgi:hypothetical protein
MALTRAEAIAELQFRSSVCIARSAMRVQRFPGGASLFTMKHLTAELAATHDHWFDQSPAQHALPATKLFGATFRCSILSLRTSRSGAPVALPPRQSLSPRLSPMLSPSCVRLSVIDGHRNFASSILDIELHKLGYKSRPHCSRVGRTYCHLRKYRSYSVRRRSFHSRFRAA